MTYFGSSKVFEPSASAVPVVPQAETPLTTGLDSARAAVTRPSKPMLRYSGFEQIGSVRTYLFDHIVIGQKATHMVITADIPLFLKHHVKIQDGPALCLHTLSLEMDKVEAADAHCPSRELTEQDIIGYLATRPRPPEPKGKREKPAET